MTGPSSDLPRLPRVSTDRLVELRQLIEFGQRKLRTKPPVSLTGPEVYALILEVEEARRR